MFDKFKAGRAVAPQKNKGVYGQSIHSLVHLDTLLMFGRLCRMFIGKLNSPLFGVLQIGIVRYLKIRKVCLKRDCIQNTFYTRWK